MSVLLIIVAGMAFAFLSGIAVTEFVNAKELPND